MISQWAAMISAALATLVIGIFSVYIQWTHPDMTDTRLFLTYWKEGGILTLWLMLSLIWIKAAE